MTKLDQYWMSNDKWLKYENHHFVLREDAPQEAKASYQRYLKQREEASKRGSI